MLVSVPVLKSSFNSTALSALFSKRAFSVDFTWYMAWLVIDHGSFKHKTPCRPMPVSRHDQPRLSLQRDLYLGWFYDHATLRWFRS